MIGGVATDTDKAITPDGTSQRPLGRDSA